MGREKFDIAVGTRFGKLTITGPTQVRGGKVYWGCICDCGAETFCDSYRLRNNKTKSCGCSQQDAAHECSTVHGNARRGAQTPEYRAWRRMIYRCENPAYDHFDRYGGRGISVCNRWRESFEVFLAGMGERPGPEYSLDRYPDNDGDYEPGNCRWATRSQQMHNTSRSKPVRDISPTLGISA